MAKGEKFIEIEVPKSQPFYRVARVSVTHPKISITFLEYGGQYGVRDYLKAANSEIRQNLFAFFKDFRNCDNINDAISRYSSRHGNKVQRALEKGLCDTLRAYGKDVGSIIHIHTKRNGKGKFVIHGFRDGDSFEILGLDPEHRAHS